MQLASSPRRFKRFAPATAWPTTSSTSKRDSRSSTTSKRSPADLAQITRGVREGRGTIGAFLTDPSVYEDIKRLVGDLERNDILRALVRYSIRADSSTGDVDVEPVGVGGSRAASERKRGKIGGRDRKLVEAFFS